MKNHYYLLFTICYLIFAVSANAQPGNLDSDFDADGKLTTTFGTGIETAYATAVQTDGKIIVAGYCSPPLTKILQWRAITPMAHLMQPLAP